MDYLSGLISSRFNCTVPWLLYHARSSLLFSLSLCNVHALLSVRLLYLRNWNWKHQKNFRFRKLDIPVCGSNVSALANKLYLKNQVNNKLFVHFFRLWITFDALFNDDIRDRGRIKRPNMEKLWPVLKTILGSHWSWSWNLIPGTKFPALDTCVPACTTMGVTGMLTSKEECSTCTNKAVTLVFGKSISVSREMLAYPLLSLLAEVDLCTHSMNNFVFLYNPPFRATLTAIWHAIDM